METNFKNMIDHINTKFIKAKKKMRMRKN